LQEENELDLFEPTNVAAPTNGAAYRSLYSRIKFLDNDFEDPIASPTRDAEYTRQDVLRL
jgi:hypothetical protein